MTKPIDAELEPEEPTDPFDPRGTFKKWASWLKEPGELQNGVARAIGKSLVAGIRDGSVSFGYMEEHFLCEIRKDVVERFLGRRIP